MGLSFRFVQPCVRFVQRCVRIKQPCVGSLNLASCLFIFASGDGLTNLQSMSSIRHSCMPAPAKAGAGIQEKLSATASSAFWIPAFAGMTISF